MKILFTKSNKLGSKLIQWGTDAPVSHVAYAFDDKIVFHSNYKGCHVEFLSSFLKHNEVVFSLDYQLDLITEENIYQVLAGIEGSKYDYMGILFFAIKALMYKLFQANLPKKNPWADANSYFCVEVYQVISQFIGVEVKAIDMTTPYDLYLTLKGAKNADVSNA